MGHYMHMNGDHRTLFVVVVATAGAAVVAYHEKPFGSCYKRC